MAPSSDEEKEEEEELELKELERALLSHCSSTSDSPAPVLSLSYIHASSSIRGRSKHIKASASSSSGSTTLASCHKSPWDEHLDMDPDELPSISPPDLIKTLLSQLVSSISAMTRAFVHLQAKLRAYSGAVEGGSSSSSSNVTMAPEEKVMVEELQRLSSLHTRLYTVLQEQGAIILKEERDDHDHAGSVESRMLRSYEGIISRFHDEIRKKEAVVEALKDTLAKSMLNGEKLQRRLKTLEAKLSVK